MSLSHIETAIRAIARGEFALVLDEERDDQGDLVCAAEHATPDKLGFMIRHTSGLVCTSLPRERMDVLRFPNSGDASSDGAAALDVSVDYLHGTRSGISASDRALTVRALASAATTRADFTQPGHVFPLGAAAAGVLARPRRAEAASDLAKLAGFSAAGVLSELVEDDGSVAGKSSLLRFAAQHAIPVLGVAELAAYRRRTERWLEPLSEAPLPTRFGTFVAHAYRSPLDGLEHVALVYGSVFGADDVPVRVHSECLTSEVFGSLRCDCRDQLDAALAAIARAGKGVLVYLRGHEGRGIGLGNKLRAYALQDRGEDTAQANLTLGLPVDARSYDVAAEILRDLGLHSIRLLSNNPAKFEALSECGITITRRERLITQVHAFNQKYLRDKRARLGHDLVIGPTSRRALRG